MNVNIWKLECRSCHATFEIETKRDTLTKDIKMMTCPNCQAKPEKENQYQVTGFRNTER